MSNDILVKIGADITDFSRKMAEGKRELQSFSETNKQTFEDFKTVGKLATTGGILLTSGLGYAVKVAADFETAMSSVKAISGTTGDEFKSLEDKARDLGSTTSFSATEAANGFEYLALAGWDVDQMLNGMEGVLHLAEAGNLDLARSADLVTDSMAGLGLEVDDLDGYLDKVAQTSASSNTDIDALMEAFVVAGGTLNRLNVPLEESNAFLGILANRGFKGAEAGTAINSIMARLTQTTGPAADALEEMGVSAYDADGNFRGMETVMSDVEKAMSTMTDAEKAHYTQQLAGLNHGKTFTAMINGLGDEYHDLKGEIEGSQGSLIDMRNTMKDNLGGELENLKSALEEVAISLGTALLPTVKRITKFVQKLVDWFNNLSGKTKRNIAIFTAVAAALLLVVGPIMLLIGFIPAIIAGFAAIGTVIAAIASPIGLIVGLALGAVTLIIAYWSEISDFFTELWEGIVEITTEVWEFISDIFANTVEFFIELWSGVVEFFTELWETITEVVTEAWEFISEIISEIVEFIIESIVSYFDSLSEGLSNIMEGIADFFGGIWDLIKNVILGPVLLIINLVTGNFEELRENASQIFTNIKDAIERVWNGIKTFFSGIVDTIFNVVSDAFTLVKDTVKNLMSNTADIISDMWQKARDTVKTVVSSIIDTVSNLFTDMWQAVKDKMTDIFDAISDAWGNVMDFFGEIDLFEIGKNVLQGFIDGISSMFQGLTDIVNKIVGFIPNWIKKTLGIKSPSRVLMELGRHTGAGLADGIAGMRGAVEDATQSLAQAAMGTEIDLAYNTPDNVAHASLSSAVNGSVDVDARDGLTARAIDKMSERLDGMQVVMDGETVGVLTAPTVSREIQAGTDDQMRRNGGRNIR